MNAGKTDARLLEAARLGRPGSAFADVGTDHAYLPIYLIKEGLSPRGLATDLRDGPVAAARRNLAAAGISDRVTVRKCDGLDGIGEFAPDDIYILGMGGELIRDILSRSDYVRRQGVRLILQPMTKPEELRYYLSSAGFAEVDSALVRSSGRIYQIIAAEYDGKRRELSPEAALLGEINVSRGGQLLAEYARRLSRSRRRAADGIASAGGSAEELYLLADALERIAEAAGQML